MIHSECASHSSLVSPQAVMPWPPRITPIASGFARLDRRDVQAELEARAPPRHPDHPAAEASAVSSSPSAAVAIAMPAVGVQVVDVRRIHQAVHRGVDRRRRAALAVQRSSRTRRPSRPRAPPPGRRSTRARSRSRRSTARPAAVSVPRSPPEPFTHSSSTGSPVDRVGLRALRGGVAAGVVRVPRVRARAGSSRAISSGRPSGRLVIRLPIPACVPPTRSASIFSW